MSLQSIRDNFQLYNPASQIGKHVHAVILLFANVEPQQSNYEVTECPRKILPPHIFYYVGIVKVATTLYRTLKD